MDGNWNIRRLDEEYEWDEFSCGESDLDTFLQQHAEENDRRGVSRLRVATRSDEVRIAGYYASATGVFQRQHLPKQSRSGLPGYPLPTIHMGRLAVDKESQGQRLGEFLLFHFLQMALDVSGKVGVFAVDVWAKHDKARAFYLRYGFFPLIDDPLHLFLPMDSVRELLAD